MEGVSGGGGERGGDFEVVGFDCPVPGLSSNSTGHSIPTEGSWRFGDGDGFGTFTYWFIHETKPESAELHLSWPHRGIDVTYTIAEGEIVVALDTMEDLTGWPWTDQEREDGTEGPT
ncbi:hypothetical protein V3C41_01615 [Paenarthrobacter nicotinovorans]|uniref:Uncharacterized protein n=1 Tax=Paenarthrobacter nicotinovorans TaxID=29320 RepID=A0ABV0GMM3_PAENI